MSIKKVSIVMTLVSFTVFLSSADAQQVTESSKRSVNKNQAPRLEPNRPQISANLPARVDVIDGHLKNLSPLLEATNQWVVYKSFTYDVVCPSGSTVQSARIESQFGEGQSKTFSGTKSTERVTFLNTPCIASPELYMFPTCCEQDKLKENILYDVNVEIIATCKKPNANSEQVVFPSKIQLIVNCDMRKGGIAKRAQLSWKHTCPSGYYLRETPSGSFIYEEVSTTQGFGNPMLCKKKPQ